MQTQVLKAWILVKGHCRDAIDEAKHNERGELVTWLILAAGLAVVALAAVAAFEIIIDNKVDDIDLGTPEVIVDDGG